MIDFFKSFHHFIYKLVFPKDGHEYDLLCLLHLFPLFYIALFMDSYF